MENIYSTDWDATQDHPGYEWNRVRLGKRIGATMLGASVYELGPGQRSFPYHCHHGNEEMLIVLDGEVDVRTPQGVTRATRGDAVAFPRGADGAHQVHNPCDATARVIILSTMVDPDIVEYPDSDKIGVFARRPPGGSTQAGFRKMLDATAEKGYFDGE